MLDNVSLSKNAIQKIGNFEKVARRALEAADRISIRLFLYALAIWDIYRLFTSKH